MQPRLTGMQTELRSSLAPGARLRALEALLKEDLEFHGEQSTYASHVFHAFAAKFPPQLPTLCITRLTTPEETVLDPMMGSGTAVLEAALNGRTAIGFDIDPFAVKLSRVKTTPIDDTALLDALTRDIVARAAHMKDSPEVERALAGRFEPATKAFADYWFSPVTQHELMALLMCIDMAAQSIPDSSLRVRVREFFEVTLSSVIITKSGGVSLARDLAHTRPHKQRGKVPRSAVTQFRQRAAHNIRGLASIGTLAVGRVTVKQGDARNLANVQPNSSVHLVISSPPYANAIDYMRAHKFSLVWLGMPIRELSHLRSRYIGSERTTDMSENEPLPQDVETTISLVADRDSKKAVVLKKYFLEMRLVLSEIERVLIPGCAAVIVVGPSTMRGIQVDTAHCLGSIAATLERPLVVVGVAQRRLDRDRRMMPASNGPRGTSVIEQRIHQESILGLFKPFSG